MRDERRVTTTSHKRQETKARLRRMKDALRVGKWGGETIVSRTTKPQLKSVILIKSVTMFFYIIKKDTNSDNIFIIMEIYI